MYKEFLSFLKKFAVIGAAIGIVTGQAVTNFVNILVANTINPLLKSFLSNPEAICSLENYGACASNLISGTINFIVVLLFVFILVKFLLNKFVDEV
jgi:large-conductance mechanosensitive channel